MPYNDDDWWRLWSKEGRAELPEPFEVLGEGRRTASDGMTQELVLMIEGSGFGEIELYGDYTEGEPTSDTEFVVFHARKPRT